MLAKIEEDEMADRKLKTWTEAKALRPLSAEAQAANATGVEQEIREIVFPDVEPRGAMAMLGFARRFRATRRSQEWVKEIRGED